jgi:group II intron reverse transcriptase/maturase
MPKQRPEKSQKLRNNEYYDTQGVFDELFQKSLDGEVFSNLMSFIRSDSNIKLAYRNIKSNSGSNTAGVDDLTIKHIEKMSEVEYVHFVKEKLNWYKPKAVRRVEIEKYPGSGTYRPLGIPSIADRLVQQCILQVLEPICEAKFHDKSYGFRPNRSCENALAQANSYMYAGKMYFVVDVDIKGFFDNVDHSKLIKQMWTMGIRDKKLISIIREMLKAPIKMPSGEILRPTKGTPQGGILSPLLSNIVLNELDWWVQSQWVDIPTRHNYSCKDSKVNMLKKHTALKEMYIVRYADDFKIFCRTHAVAVKTFHAVKQWLKERLKLDISEEKSRITNLKKHYTEFLGFKMKVRQKGKRYVTSTHMSDKAIEKVAKNLIAQVGMIQRATNKKERYAQVSNYNSMVIGVHNYYNMAVQVSQDFKKIARQITCVMKNRFRQDFKSMKQIKRANARKRKKGRKPKRFDIVINRAVSERYGASDQMRYLNEFAIAPIGFVKMRYPMKKAQSVNKYTVCGRAEIHKNLKMDMSVIRWLMENPVLNRTIQYADNRISRFIAQWGKCSVTNMLLQCEEIHCHHKKLRSVSKNDDYANLVIVHKDIHRLIHATDSKTISKYLQKHNTTINFSKLNKLRNAVGNCEIDKNVLDNPNVKYVMMESRVN